jgi:hypothetical protein
MTGQKANPLPYWCHPLNLASSNRKRVLHKIFNPNLYVFNIFVLIRANKSQCAYLPGTLP